MLNGLSVVEVVDLSGKVDRQGRLAWDVPEGRWTLFRFASAVIEGHEYDVDVLDETAVEAHFKRMGKAVLADAGPLARKAATVSCWAALSGLLALYLVINRPTVSNDVPPEKYLRGMI